MGDATNRLGARRYFYTITYTTIASMIEMAAAFVHGMATPEAAAGDGPHGTPKNG